ncbi:MAG: hypothetical protein K2K46_01425 [Lachnospiraceae bacterium]|nr:hypothetical protein [Lachnospiraceae bacterium]
MPNKTNKSKRKISIYIDIWDLIDAMATALIIILVFIIAYTVYSTYSASSTTVEPDNTDISIKIENISHNLAEASSELSDIQKELEGRIEYVESLKKEAEIAENVISLSDEQVNAIQAKLNQEFEASSGKSFFQSIFISAVFFVLGLIIQPIFKAIKKRFGKKYRNNTSTSYGNKYSDDEIARAIMLLDTIKQKENSTKN